MGNIRNSLLMAALLCVSFAMSARTYLVAVGVGDYSNYPQKTPSLNLPVADAKAIAEAYAKNTNVDYVLLLDEKATKSRIVRAMKKVYSLAGKDDVVIFYFSGHGYPGGFCASDGRVPYSRIRTAMSESKCHNKIILADACHSGAMRVEANASGNAANKEASKANVMMFLASRNTETSIEAEGMENGVFTTFLIGGMQGWADADGNRIITARELFDFVHNGVKDITENKQHPVMWGKFNDDMPVIKLK